jgi:AraC-like DNA-binding protein/mannose-6-phosphate isomerase-like protein (cupin superfamily)
MDARIPQQTQFIQIGRVPPQPHWAMAAHAHPYFHELILVLHGVLETHIHGVTLQGRRGDVLYYPLGEVHAEHSSGDEPLETLFLSWRWLPEAHQPAAGWKPLVNDRAGRIQTLLQWMREHYPPNNTTDAILLDHLLALLLAECDQLSQSPEESLAVQMRTFIQHNLHQPLTLENLAARAGMSKYHFAHEFKRRTGLAPMAFLRQERVAAARSLILSTPLTLRAIAAQVGFASEYQLSRVFHRETGKAPSQLRHL